VASDPGELDEPAAFRDVVIEIEGRRLIAWEIEGDAAEGPVVIVTPGWGDSRIGALPRLGALRGWASQVVAWDPPGLGETDGLCGMGVVETRQLRAMVERYRERGVVLYGWSLGGGASVAAGDAAGVIGAIAEAPYRRPITPARNVLRAAGLPWRANLPVAMWLLGARLGMGPGWRGFDRAEAAARVAAPVLVIHGTEDAISPIEDGRRIAESAPAGRLVEIEGGGHNDLWTEPPHRDTCASAVREFAASLTGSPASSRG
jgi:pimeloyl-ACP methyl ester carboxylesterase